MNDQTITEKKENLRKIIEGYGSLAVAFSGGVDSTFLLAFANEVIPGNVAAVTADAHLAPEREMRETEEFCRRNGIARIVIDIDALEIEGFRENPPDRCYICKKAIFKRIAEAASEKGFSVVAEGSNADDTGDYRPGMKAIKELGIKSPLLEAGLKKTEIRQLAKEMGLAVWDKPSSACLASRIPYGEIISKERIKMIDGAEEYLSRYGYRICRVRMHGNVARIELDPEDIAGFMEKDIRNDVFNRFKEIGFDYVTLDLRGYRTGSLNETLAKEPAEKTTVNGLQAEKTEVQNGSF